MLPYTDIMLVDNETKKQRTIPIMTAQRILSYSEGYTIYGLYYQYTGTTRKLIRKEKIEKGDVFKL